MTYLNTGEVITDFIWQTPDKASAYAAKKEVSFAIGEANYNNAKISVKPTHTTTCGDVIGDDRSITIIRTGPPILGLETSLKQYSIYNFTIDASSKLSNIQWEDNEYIKCIGDKGQPSIEINPVKVGNSFLSVSYNYKNSTERFQSTIPISISATPLYINGKKSICYNIYESYSIDNLPPRARVSWSTSSDLEPSSGTSPIFQCKNMSPEIGMAEIAATITLPSGYNISTSYNINLFTPADPSFDKGNFGDGREVVNENLDITLMGHPNWAKNFFWSADNVNSICIQGYDWTCISFNSFEIWDTEVNVNVEYESPCGDKYVVTQAIPIIHGKQYLISQTSQQLEVKQQPVETLKTENSNEIKNISIYTIKRVKCINKNYPKGVISAKIDISSLPKGIYIIRIFDGKNWSTQKVVK